MNIKGRFIECGAGDEHILRRLGGAVVVLWDILSAADQHVILEQAVFIHDRDQSAQLKEQIESFIRKHKVRNAEAG